VLNAVDNTFASSTAIVVPYLGFALLNLTGSWLPHMAFGSMLKLISGAAFVKDAQVGLKLLHLQWKMCRIYP